jgi:hypothetical protein
MKIIIRPRGERALIAPEPIVYSGTEREMATAVKHFLIALDVIEKEDEPEAYEELRTASTVEALAKLFAEWVEEYALEIFPYHTHHRKEATMNQRLSQEYLDQFPDPSDIQAMRDEPRKPEPSLTLEEVLTAWEANPTRNAGVQRAYEAKATA